MVDQLYNWTRFWNPRGHSFWPDGGFLSEPESTLGRLLNPGAVTLQSMEPSVPCLVLLGEPGIGKSKEIEKQKALSEVRAKEHGDTALFFDLGVYSSDSTLYHEIFGHPLLQAWLRATHHLILFLDSLDEGLIAASSLTRLLAQKLKDLPRGRLRLRVTCRTAEWKSSFEQGLRNLFGDDAVEVFELLPLCRRDALSAAEQNGVDPARFMSEVVRNDVEPFASKPVTLNFLLKLFKKNNEFPSTQTGLYLEGCKALCDDTETRKDSRRIGKLDLDQRLMLAARVAAITVFGNRSEIWIGSDLTGGAADEQVSLRDLCGGTERRDDETFPADEAGVREVLEYTGLFSSAGQDRLRWRHQTYAEFLAALYLDRRRFTLNQRLDLILHHGDGERKLVPQLQETAAWLAGMDQDVFQAIMESEPDVLLRSDVARTDGKDRERLVATLLRLHDEDERSASWFPVYMLKKLTHPSLADQLRPYIANRAKSFGARQLAIHIAHACEAKDLQRLLAEVSLDESVPLRLRCDALHAVGEIGDPETKLSLKGLVGDDPTDPDKELKGYALEALWPTCLTTEELFDSLSPVMPWWSGSYDHFLSGLADRLRPIDILPALQWLREQPHSRSESAAAFNSLKDSIILMAWEQLDSAPAIELFARVALSRLLSYKPIVKEGGSAWHDLTGGPVARPFSMLVSDSDTKRRAVLRVMIVLLCERFSSGDNQGQFGAFSHSNPFLLGSDLAWFLEEFESSASEQEREILAQLIAWVFRWYDLDHIDVLYTAVQQSRLIAERFGQSFAAIPLDSPEAVQLRARHARDLEMREARNAELPRLEPSPAERIVDLLDQFEAGDYSAWWKLNYLMLVRPDGIYDGSDYHPDLRSSPGWQSAEEQTKARIRRASREYLLHGEPYTDQWLTTDWIDRPALAGYKALYLLVYENPELVTTLPSAAWRVWAPVVLAMIATGMPDEEIQRKLIANAYSHAPKEIIATLVAVIDRQSRQFSVPHVIEKVEGLWDVHIADAIHDKLADKTLKPSGIAYLLDKLLVHNDERARKLAESYVRFSTSPTNEQLSIAVAAGRSLMLNTRDGGWSVLWPIIQRTSDFGRRLVEDVASHAGLQSANVASEMSENELADLYVWLTRNYPQSEDPGVPRGYGSYDLTPRRLVATWRDSILTRLERCGTRQACEEIRRIAREYPELDWLKWVLRSAQEHARRSTWDPLKPKEILKLAQDSNAGLVQSGEQLLRIVIEALKRLEQKLQDGAGHELWNEEPVCKPKDERRLAQKVEAHLKEALTDRGVVANREVEVQRRRRTDIHVNAVTKLANGEVFDSINLVIEVKGCWYQTLKGAMKKQLVDQYLADSHCDYGLYLVGWFRCDEWDSDYRKKRTPKWSVLEAQTFFDEQARRLSLGGKLIKAFVLNAAL
jgi:hypothetical protein